LLDEIAHPKKDDYPHQRIFIVAIENYVYLVPYVETEDELFLKTIIPSRKFTKETYNKSCWRWPMSSVKLSKEEKQLLKAVEAGEFESVLTKKRRAELVSAAKDTVRKDKRINIRISNRDLKAVQLKASEEGIPYQTLASSIIHKYISGSLKDISADKRSQSDVVKSRS